MDSSPQSSQMVIDVEVDELPEIKEETRRWVRRPNLWLCMS